MFAKNFHDVDKDSDLWLGGQVVGDIMLNIFAISGLFLSLTVLEKFAKYLDFEPEKWFSDPRSIMVGPIILDPM